MVSYFPLALLAAILATHSISCVAAQEEEFYDFDGLSPSAHTAYPPNVRGNWTLVFATKQGLCPSVIWHRGWTRRNHVIHIYHNFIAHDGVACVDPDRATSRRRLRFYRGSDVNAKIDNNADIDIPAKLQELIQLSGPNIDARYSAGLLGEEFYVGYEGRDRLCNGTVQFNAGTLAFLIRPFQRDVKVKNIDVPLTVGKKWLIMVPKFKAVSCLYESEVLPVHPETPLPTDTTDGSEGGPLGDAGIANNGAGENGLEAGKSESRECFPADALVTLEDGSAVSMSQLRIGDKVQVGPGQFSEIFMFTHKLPRAKALFVGLTLDSGHKLTLTPGHYLYINGDLMKASIVKVGDYLQLGDGRSSRVAEVSRVWLSGLYNPQTVSGNIVVNGVLTSTYTEAVQPTLAHGLLSPLRFAYQMMARDPTAGLFEVNSRCVPEYMRRMVSST